MINMDQVRTLEMKVKQTVQLIVHLRRENDSLRTRLTDTEVRLQELETLLEGLKASQNEMESGIRSALQELDHLDDGRAPEAPLAAAAEEAEAGPEPVLVREEPAVVAEAAGSDEVAVGEVVPEEEYSATEEEFISTEEQFFQEAVQPAEESVPDEPEPQQPGLGIF